VLLVVSIYVGYVTEAVARERRRRLEVEDRLHKELQGMTRVQALVSTLSLEVDPDRLFQGVAETARSLLDVPSSVFWRAKDEARFRAAPTAGFPAPLAGMDEALARAVAGGKVLRIAAGQEGESESWGRRARELGLAEVLLAPFTDRVASHQGCLVVAWPAPHEHLEVEEEALQVLVQQAGICIENSALYRLLGQTRDVWQAAFQSIPTPIVIVDANSRIVQANPSFLALGEFDFASLVGTSVQEVLRGACHRDGRPAALEDLEAARNGPARLTLPRLKGEFDVTRGPYLGAAGSSGGTVWVLRKLSADIVAG
jgi:PAS domain-containing protein